jgi:hypothetical protein
MHFYENSLIDFRDFSELLFESIALHHYHEHTLPCCCFDLPFAAPAADLIEFIENPAGNSPARTIELRFAEEMIAPDQVGEGNAPIALTPEHPGKWTWQSTRSGIFTPPRHGRSARLSKSARVMGQRRSGAKSCPRIGGARSTCQHSARRHGQR